MQTLQTWNTKVQVILLKMNQLQAISTQFQIRMEEVPLKQWKAVTGRIRSKEAHAAIPGPLNRLQGKGESRLLTAVPRTGRCSWSYAGGPEQSQGSLKVEGWGQSESGETRLRKNEQRSDLVGFQMERVAIRRRTRAAFTSWTRPRTQTRA